MGSCGIDTVSGVPVALLTWAQVLNNGNVSGGSDPTITSGDTIRGQNSTTGAGGIVPIVTGATTNAGSASGNFTVAIGSAGAGGAGGRITVVSGTGGASATGNGGAGGDADFAAGTGGNTSDAGSTAGAGGDLTIGAADGGNATGGGGDTGGAGGDVLSIGGGGGTGVTGGAGGDYTITAGAGGNGSVTGGAAGNVAISAGAAGTGGNIAGGSVSLTATAGVGAGADGDITYVVDGGTTTQDGDTGRWLFPAEIGVKGGDPSNGVSGFNDITIGTTADASTGISIITSSTGLGILAFIDSNAPGTTEAGVDYLHSTRQLFLRSAAGRRVVVTSTTMHPNTTLGMGLGLAANRWKRNFLNHLVPGVLILTGAATLDDETLVKVTVAGPGNVDLTLPSADTGWWYLIDYDTPVDTGTVRLIPDGTDDINGTAGTVSLPQINGICHLYSEDGASWRARVWVADFTPT